MSAPPTPPEKDSKRHRPEAGSLREGDDQQPAAAGGQSVDSDGEWAEAWELAPGAYQKAKQEAAALGHAGKKEIEFLCAKGVRNKTVELLWRFDLIVSPPTEEWKDRRNALCDIVGLLSGSRPQLGTARQVPDEISFAKFIGKYTAWDKGPECWVFFRDHPKLKHRPLEDVLIQRVQLFGSCAIHAPVTMQHYLVALHTNGETEMTLDMPKWLRKHAKRAMLEGIVFENGVVSTTVLAQILVPDEGSKRPRLEYAFTCTSIVEKMQQYGPGLVGFWRVASDFNKSVGSHVGAAPAEDVTNPDGRHAMLVVGHRRTKEGDLRLLLQNWWRKKQFVEVDEAYFNSCNECDVVFVATPQKYFPAAFDVTGDAFAVCAADGAGASGTMV